MYIKEGLVFQKSSGALIGYLDLGEINNILHDAKSQIENPGNCNRPLAKRMLVFMVRGIFSSLKFPYAQFPASSTKGGDLFPLFCQVISRLTWLGIHVLAATCDGASDNRRLFSLHNCGDKKNLVYKTTNVFSKVDEEIFYLRPPSLAQNYKKLFSEGKAVGMFTLFYIIHVATLHLHFSSVMEAPSTGILWSSYTREIQEHKPVHQDCHLFLSLSMSMSI